MKFIKNKTKSKERKKIIFAFILGIFLTSIVGVSATTLLLSNDVTYDNSSSGMSATTVQDALDELNEKAKNAPECDSNGVCTVTCPNGLSFFTTSTGYLCRKLFASELLTKKAVTSGDGLYVDDTETGRYVYKGASPNNYITFSGSTWRILAVESDGTLKIMKQDSLGVMAYDSNSSGAWSSATLKTYLNGTYYNTLSTTDKSYIQNHSFNVGDVSGSSSLTTTINQEKAKIWTGNIALANVSDVIKSNTNASICGSFNSINNNYSTCRTSSFIHTMKNGWIWLLSYQSGTTIAWCTSGHGAFGWAGGVSYADPSVFPVLHLSSDIKLSGSGTSSDPYTID